MYVFHSLSPCMDFHLIFRICLTQEGLDLVTFWGVSGNILIILDLVGVSKPLKPIHGYSPNCQDVFNPRRSIAGWVLGSV